MMIRYILQRIMIAIPTLLVISFVVFFLIQLPPGSFLDAKIAAMELEGGVDMAEIETLKNTYHFDRPMIVQYYYWITGFVTGDMGKSFETDVEVTRTLAELVPVTAAISLFTILFTWSLAIPFGIIAAVKRNSPLDYSLTFIGLTAMATPAFIIALIFQVVMQSLWPQFDPTGLISREYVNVPWSMAKFADLLKHLWVPVFILGVGGTAGMIRILRANVIDELKKQYVLCARARGMHPVKVILKYPVRVAINPLVSGIGSILPSIISGSMIISIVLGLPTLGPRVLQALMNQDTYLAASCVFIQCVLAVVGILLSDLLLAVVDPRIKFGGK
ncbi:ABC transporter permease [Kiritimatiellaeota bacterium B1221]|nr:ABC transporter permease [Kiritimatiellaeota bacterium B1221]